MKFVIKFCCLGCTMCFSKSWVIQLHLEDFYQLLRDPWCPFAVRYPPPKKALPFLVVYINRFTWEVVFCTWLSPSITFLRLIHIIACIGTSFYFIAIIFHYMGIPQFAYSPVNGHLGCSHFLAMINNAAKNNHVQIFAWIYQSHFWQNSF